jgi:Zn-dependent protease
MIRRASLKIGSVGPIEVNVNITWLVVFAILVYWLRTGYVAESAPGLGGVVAWTVSVLGAVLLFFSVLAHELSHSLVALRNGLIIRRITLFIFGGMAHMESEPRSAGVEFRMALAGPVASLVIAAVCGALRFLVFKGDATSVAALILEYAFFANLALACFNLVPGYPLDGGRLLRALLWRLTRDFVKSTVIAATVGRVFGLFMVFAGVTLAVAYEEPAFLWPVLVGTFLERLAFLSAYRLKVTRLPTVIEGGGFIAAGATPRPRYYQEDKTGE